MGKGKHIKNEEERVSLFMSYVKRDSESDCWVWTGDCMTNGYGRIEINRKKVGAHRFSYSAFRGEIPKGLEVAHACDNRKCVNPQHLWLATHAENMRDMRIKGRARNQYTKNVSQNEKETDRINRRFYSYINEEGGCAVGMDTACYLWEGTFDRNGYPVFAISPNRVVKAHRYAFYLKKGLLETGERVSKLCNNKACVRAEHICKRDEE